MTATRASRKPALAHPQNLPVIRRQGRSGSAQAALERELASIPNLDRAALVARVVQLCGFHPPPRFSRKLMELAVAYKLQEKVLGGLKPATRRFLLEAAKAQQNPARSKPATARFKAGTVLMREWKGVTHQATVLEDGFLFDGKRYRTLSEIAGRITGAHWSGPTFFGLTKLAKEAGHGSE
jgi:hypothetical protein